MVQLSRGKFCRLISGAIPVICLGLFLVNCAGEGGQQKSQEQPTAEKVEEGIWTDIQALYKTARDKGEKVPENTYEWVKEDLEGIGDWQYKVVDIPDSSPEDVTEKLNALGNDRWECVFIEKHDSSRRFYFKKPVRVYLKNIPLSDILKFIPEGGSGE